jgi:CRP-like cAMP-binding protein
MASSRDTTETSATSAASKAAIEADARRLREFKAFENFTDAELQHLAGTAHHHSTSAPWPLVYEKTPSDACYILLSGEVGVYVGRDRVATLGAGEVIGESALLRGQLRSATVTTTGPAEVLRIEQDDLTRLLEEMPALRETIHATVEKHAPAVLDHPAAEAEPQRAKLNIAIPVELVNRFERTVQSAGVDVATALEDAVTKWVEANGG